MRLSFVPRLLLVFSAALYVGCGPAGNEETGSAQRSGPPTALDFTPSGTLEKFVVSEAPVRLTGEAADTVFTDSGGNERRLRDFEGQAVLLNFWATWCAPCIHEMPSLDRLEQAKGGDDFIVIAMSNDRGGANVVDPFYEETGLTALGKFFDPRRELGRALEVTGLPTTILIDKNGYERGRLMGPAEWDAPEAKALVDAVVGE